MQYVQKLLRETAASQTSTSGHGFQQLFLDKPTLSHLYSPDCVESFTADFWQREIIAFKNIREMYTPKYITDQLQRDPLVVEHSLKHTVVLKPGFQNRRNQSQYLKNSFPAGFQIRDKLTEKLGSSILQEHKSVGYANPYGSYTDWTKGERDSTDSISADLTDPYADVAGPYLDEMMRNRNLTQKSVNGPSRHSDVVAIEMRLHNRNEKNPPKKSVKSLSC